MAVGPRERIGSVERERRTALLVERIERRGDCYVAVQGQVHAAVNIADVCGPGVEQDVAVDRQVAGRNTVGHVPVNNPADSADLEIVGQRARARRLKPDLPLAGAGADQNLAGAEGAVVANRDTAIGSAKDCSTGISVGGVKLEVVRARLGQAIRAGKHGIKHGRFADGQSAGANRGGQASQRQRGGGGRSRRQEPASSGSRV
jgi:hypothetical protein